MNFNTYKTILGFMLSLIDRALPFSLRSGSIKEIYNYRPID